MSAGFWGLFNGLTLGLALAVSAVGVALILWMSVACRSAMGQLKSIGPEVYEAPGIDALGLALRRQYVRKLADGRYLVREHPDTTIETWLERYVLHRLAFEAGGWITGLALIFTFFLIALVLADDVGPAIRSTSNMSGLSEAVRKMGAKFVVSMLGIGLTIAHGVCRGMFNGSLHHAASELSARLTEQTTVLSDYHAETNERTAQSTALLSDQTAQLYGLVHARHQQLMDSMADMSKAVRSLGSIEVSVRDIGNELTVKLQNVVKDDIVAGIRKDLEEVTDRLCDALSTSFATTVQEQLAGVNGELKKIESAISSQAHGQVEELLHKLGDAVSGGFATESSRMKDALARFVEVVPLLEHQMRALIENAGSDLAKRGAETAQANEALIGQLQRVLKGIEHQQQTSAALGQQMAGFVAQTQDALTRSVSEAQQQMTDRSKVNLDDLTSAVRAATGDATEVYRSLVEEVRQGASILHDAREATAETAKHLDQSALSVREITRQVNDSMSALRSVADSLATNVDAAQSAVKEGAQVLHSTLGVVQQQQKFVDDLSGRWPQLTREYLDASNQAFIRVAEAWTRHVASIEQSVGRMSNGFTDSASEFASAVEDLGGHVQNLRNAVQGSNLPVARAT